MAAKKWRKATIQIGTNDTALGSESSWTSIAECYVINGSFGVNWTTTDATTFDDDFQTDAKVQKQAGSVDLTFRYDPEDAGQIALKAAADDASDAPYNFRISLDDDGGTNPTRFAFQALVTSFQKASSGAVNSLVDWQSRLEVQSATTYTAAA